MKSKSAPRSALRTALVTEPRFSSMPPCIPRRGGDVLILSQMMESSECHRSASSQRRLLFRVVKHSGGPSLVSVGSSSFSLEGQRAMDCSRDLVGDDFDDSTVASETRLDELNIRSEPLQAVLQRPEEYEATTQRRSKRSGDVSEVETGSEFRIDCRLAATHPVRRCPRGILRLTK